MSDADDALAGARQLGDSQQQWGATSRELAQKYNADGTQWARVEISKAALELGQLLASRSRYAASKDPSDTVAGFVLDADGHGYDLWVELGAVFGSAAETAQVQALATAGDARAAAVLKFAAAVQKGLGL